MIQRVSTRVRLLSYSRGLRKIFKWLKMWFEMSFSTESLYLTFREIALRTGQLIKDGTVSGLGIFEETLTDVNLIEINRRHSDHICTYKYTKREEGSKSGADWLWCIGEPGSWISLAVQAKIVNPKNSRCQHLDYIGKRTDYSSKQQSQRALLVKFAHAHKLLPIYCVYNYLPSNVQPYAKAVLPLSNIETSEWSCFFISPKYVRKLTEQRRNKQSDLLPYGIPWSYPFLYASSIQDNSNLASLVAQALANLREEFTSLYVESVKANLSRGQLIRRDDPNPLSLITRDLPKIAERLLKGSIKPSDSPFAGLSIVSSVPIEKVLHKYHSSPKPRKARKSRSAEERNVIHNALPGPDDSTKLNMVKAMNMEEFFSKK
jgi:hypothetical protein